METRPGDLLPVNAKNQSKTIIENALLRRIATAVILAPLIIIAIFTTSPFWFAFISGIIFLYASWEWTVFLTPTTIFWRLSYVFLHLILIVLFYYLFLKTPQRYYLMTLTFFILVILWWLIAIYWIIAYEKQKSVFYLKLFKSVIGLIVLIPCWLALNKLRWMPEGEWLLTYLLCLIWIADISAYFGGRYFGKIKLVPRVSPGKTLAGVYSALLSAILVALVGNFLIPIKIHLGYWLAISILTVAISIAGDLFISVLKRLCHIKDTGTLLPGHGGMLDRIDSLNSAVPFFTLGLLILGIH